MRNVRLQNAVIALVVGLSMLLLLPACFAQDVAGMTGQVTDKSGGAVTGVEVTLRNPSTGFKLVEFTNSIGSYRFAQIPPGQGYQVIFKAKGFNPLEVKDIYLTVATIRTQNAALEVGTRTDVVQVTASASEVTIDTTTASIGNTFDVEQLNSLPVQQRMDPTALFTMQPGVTETASVTGARVDQNNVTVDGLDVNDFATGGAAQQATGLGYTTGFTIVGHAPVDSVEELHATVGGNQAASGPGGGGQFQMETKSGTNKFHGNLNEYHRDPDLVANSWFSKDTTPIVPRNHLIQNQFGGNVGGPIILPKLFNGRDRAFFFFDYYNSKTIKSALVQETVPLNTFRADNPGGPQLGYIGPAGATEYLSPAQVQSFDPAGIGEDSTWVGPSDPTKCPIIPPTGATFLTSYSCRFPHSNNAVTGDQVNSGGYLFNAPDTQYETNYVGRVDVNLNDNMKMFFVFHISRQNSVETPNAYAGDPPTNPFVDRTYSFAIGHTWVLGGNKTNRVVLGETVQKYAFPNSFNPDGTTDFTFGDGTGPAIVSALYNSPAFSARRIPIPVLGDDFSWTKGSHTWQFGGTFKDILAHDTTAVDFNIVEIGMGGLDFNLCGPVAGDCGINTHTQMNNPSMRPADINQTTGSGGLGNEAAYDYDSAFAFLLGRIGNVASDFNYTADGTPLKQLTGDQRFYRYYQTQLYAQDSWKITPSLTASYGLTYQKFSVPYETCGLATTEPFTEEQYFSARETQSALGQTGPMAVPLISYVLGGKVNNGPPLYQPEWRNLAPHFGLVWNPGFDKKLVFNAGAGVAYDRTVIYAIQGVQDANLSDSSCPIHFLLDSGRPVRCLRGCGRKQQYRSAARREQQHLEHFSRHRGAWTPVAPYQPFVANGVPYGYQSGYDFNSTIDPSLKTPYSISFNAGMQRNLRWDMVLKVSYAGRLGRRLLAQSDANQLLDFPDAQSGQTFSEAFANITQQMRAGATSATIIPQAWFEYVVAPGTGTGDGFANNTQYVVAKFGNNVYRGDFADVSQYLSTFTPLNVGGAAQFSDNTFYGNQGSSSYNALLVTLQRNMSHGLHFDFNYTWAHSIDNVSIFSNSQGDYGLGGIGQVCDLIRPRECRANSDFQEKSYITSDATYQLPIGKGKMFLNGGSYLENELVGGWEISAISSWHTGEAWGTNSNAFVASYSNDAPGILIGPKSAVKTQLVKNGPRRRERLR